MIVRLRKIGNSSGILLSKALMEQCAIKDEVNIEVRDGVIVIEPVNKKSREGWEQQFMDAGGQKDKENLIGGFTNQFDEEEWEW